ncbi:hypothetical protein HELRODRAFT_156994 [Helobdella robusta]|uniref:mRNA-capping enzyme n=1 Tax=Helobdella robusta TaxID=6412 RepID=T1EM46_HELRO|nr:hypothetical protein HELRODRAFT_156994 [Helobdella robusta]ESO04324.1 hypothetical protein HELRODRAFT_156994 [Helobdella robusta]
MQLQQQQHHSQQQEIKVPPKWLHCPRRSTLISDKFMVFKTPLDEKYDRELPNEYRFNLKMVFESVANMKLTMGLIIDLTNSTNFYNVNHVKDIYDCEYLKLSCEGFSEAPTEEITSKFYAVCKEFIEQNPSKIIGVHCTHGYNRSGFLVASYLVEMDNLSLEMALNLFNDARPPGIYKQDYLDEICKRFGQNSSAQKAPQLPTWYTDSDYVARDDDGNVVSGNSYSKIKICKGENLFMDGKVAGVITVKDDKEISRVQEKIKVMCKMQSRIFPGAHPVSMNQKNISFLTERPYKVSWKADGVRYMMLVENKDNIFMVNRDNTVFQVVQNLTFKKRKDLKANLIDTLLDGEMVFDHICDKTIPRYLIHDIIRIDGNNVGRWNFDKRLMCILKDIIEPRNKCKVNKSAEPFSVRAKPFWNITYSKSLLDGNFATKVCHEVDGLIFQPVDMGYKMGQCKEILRWKPPQVNSVDFKLSLRTEIKEGMLPNFIGDLYASGLNRPFAILSSKMTKAMRNLDQKIIECKWENGWVFIRQRTDKSFPNNYETVKAVCESISHPVSKEQLTKTKSQS